ncbi:hypothetical protein FGO68_gene14276 [Halteria grandinella]|uniref:Uncharacterized protein n=1 Tax=Halteria grandinella TaxID=5974 RepID=A0A8J8T6U2_HALGN|nr:hypothetical protein FGO68_gene14276 [Halteria grandinella]
MDFQLLKVALILLLSLEGTKVCKICLLMRLFLAKIAEFVVVLLLPIASQTLTGASSKYKMLGKARGNLRRAAIRGEA